MQNNYKKKMSFLGRSQEQVSVAAPSKFLVLLCTGISSSSTLNNVHGTAILIIDVGNSCTWDSICFCHFRHPI